MIYQEDGCVQEIKALVKTDSDPLVPWMSSILAAAEVLPCLLNGQAHILTDVLHHFGGSQDMFQWYALKRKVLHYNPISLEIRSKPEKERESCTENQ